MNILILGATSDMAKALVKILACEQHQLILAGRNMERLAPFAQNLSIKYDNTPEVKEFDALDYVSHKTFYQNLPFKPDWVISFFGYLGDQEKGQKHWPEAEKIIDTNFSSMVSILNIVAEDMEARKTGVIVGVSSVAGDRGRRSNYLYGSAKAALTTYLAGMRNRLYHAGVHVMTVKPGFVETKMTEHMNLPKPVTASAEQIAKGIIKGIKQRKNSIYILPSWRLIMFTIKTIPEFLFKKLKL